MHSSPYAEEPLSDGQPELDGTPSIPFENEGPAGSPSNTARTGFLGSSGPQYLQLQPIIHGQYPPLEDGAFSLHPASSDSMIPSGFTIHDYEPTEEELGSRQRLYTQPTFNTSHEDFNQLLDDSTTSQSEPSSSILNNPGFPDIRTTMMKDYNERDITTESRRPHVREITREQSQLPPKYPSRGTKHRANELHNQGVQESRMHGTPLLEHRMKDEKDWHPAVMHADISSELQRRANLRSYYRFPPAKGPSPGDETAPVEGHENWGFDRQHRPAILFHLVERVKVTPACIPTPFMFDGYRVLDRKKQWMTHWDDVPVTCSSSIEGYLIEALMRRNPELQHWDILARMPDRFLFKKKMRSPYRPSTLTNRTIRFRARSFNVPWRGGRGSSRALLKEMISMLPAHHVGANSTYGYRDPTTEEAKNLLAMTRSTEQHDGDEEDINNANEISSPNRTTSLELRSVSRPNEPFAGSQLRPEPSQSSDQRGNSQSQVKRRRALSGIEPPNKKARRGLRENATEKKKGSIDTLNQANQDVVGSDSPYRHLEHVRNSSAAEDGDLSALQNAQGTRAALQRSPSIGSVYTPPNGPQNLSHPDLSRYPTHHSALHPGETGSTTFDLDHHFQAGNDLLSEFLGGDLAASIQSWEEIISDTPLQKEIKKRLAEVRLDHGKTYIFICLDTAKSTKITVSTDGDFTPEMLSQQVLAENVELLKDERPLQKGKAVLRSGADQKPEHEQEPDFEEISLPVDLQYIIVCIEDRRFHKATTQEGFETPWDEIQYGQLLDEVADLERPRTGPHMADFMRTPEYGHDGPSGPTSPEKSAEVVQPEFLMDYDLFTATTSSENDPEGVPDAFSFLGTPASRDTDPNSMVENPQHTPDDLNEVIDESELPTFAELFSQYPLSGAAFTRVPGDLVQTESETASPRWNEVEPDVDDFDFFPLGTDGEFGLDYLDSTIDEDVQ